MWRRAVPTSAARREAAGWRLAALRFPAKASTWTAHWAGLTLTTTPHEPYIPRILAGNMGEWEAQRAVIAAHIRPGDVVVDAGANIGLWSLLAAARGATVLAMEPGETAFSCLERNIAQNAHVPGAVAAIRLALSDRQGSARLGAPSAAQHPRYRHRPMNTGLRSLHADAGSAGVYETVQLDTLDRVITERRIGSVAYLKIDVEGHEAAVLRGARVLLRKERPLVQFEWNPVTAALAGATAEALVGMLVECGYGHFESGGNRRDAEAFLAEVRRAPQQLHEVLALPAEMPAVL